MRFTLRGVIEAPDGGNQTHTGGGDNDSQRGNQQHVAGAKTRGQRPGNQFTKGNRHKRADRIIGINAGQFFGRDMGLQ